MFGKRSMSASFTVCIIKNMVMMKLSLYPIFCQIELFV